jgi:hypothetical protein
MVHRLWAAVRGKSGGYVGGGEDQISIDIGEVTFTEVAKEVLDVISAIRGGYIREILIKYLQDLSDELGRTPRKKDIISRSRQGKGPSERPFVVYFGSINKALIQAGLDLNLAWGYSEKQLLEPLKRLARKLGYTPSQREVREAAKRGECPSSNTYYYNYGTFNAALERAGLPLNRRVGYTKAFVLKQFRQLSSQLGRRPTRADLDKTLGTSQLASRATVVGLFGSFNNFLREVGIRPTTIIRSDAELINDLKRLKKALGRVPTGGDIEAAHKKGLCADKDVYRNRFGSLDAARNAAGFRMKGS